VTDVDIRNDQIINHVKGTFMRNYDRVNAPAPENIELKTAHIVGGGIAGLAAAAFLATDASMPPNQIHIYESLPEVGGSMDAAGDHEFGYTSRGERELEARMECLWYLCSKVPSLQDPTLTILDETHRANIDEPIKSHFRLMERQGQLRDYTGPLMSRHDTKKFMELILVPEEEIGDMDVADWFSPEFTQSVFWLCWSSMLAFRDYHSLIEVKRYLARFMMYTAGLTHLEGILHTQYNEYDSIIKPIRVWLEGMGVNFHVGTSVKNISVDTTPSTIVARGLEIQTPFGAQTKQLDTDDLVFLTNGSLTQNSTEGDTDSVTALNRDTKNRGVFSIWERLAAQDDRFGRPEKFLSDIDATNWISFFVTFKDDREFFSFMEKKTGDRAGTGGAITVTDSSWMMSFVQYGKYFPDQPEDVQVMWAYGQRSDVPGDYIKKPMIDCTGKEMLSELLYHCGLEDRIDEIASNSYVSTSAMPYITSQFMPRALGDRPRVVPQGSENLAFIGQFVELPGDVVFTVETSVRTAMMAVWELTGLEKPQIPMYEPSYDLRVIWSSVKGSLGIEDLTATAWAEMASVLPSPATALRAVRALPQPVR